MQNAWKERDREYNETKSKQKQKRIESVVRPPRIPQNDELDGNAEYGSQRHVELNNTS